MKKLNTLLALVVVALFFAACGSSVESQEKSWTSNLKTVDTYKAKYPSLKTFLEEDVTAATAIKTEADGLSDEKAKIKKMKEANGAISGGILRYVKDLENQISSTKTKEASMKNAKVADDQKKFADQAIADSKTALTNAEGAFTKSYSTKNEAIEALKLQKSKLDEVIKEFDRILAKTNDTNKKIEDEKKKEEENKIKEEEAKKPIKCEYCGNMNEPTKTKCESCGAPVEKK